MAGRNKTAMILAIVAGVLLFVAGITGVAMIEKIKSFVTDTLKINNDILNWVFLILLFLASLGGILVIIGGIFIGKNKVGLGKILITIGVGVGLIGLIIALILFAVNKTFDTSPGAIFALVGIILSVAARMMAKKDETPAPPPSQPLPPWEQQQAQQPIQPTYPPNTQSTPAPMQQPQPAYAPQPQPVYTPQPQPAYAPQPQPAQAPMARPPNACPTCGQQMQFVQQYGRYYCYKCQKYG